MTYLGSNWEVKWGKSSYKAEAKEIWEKATAEKQEHMSENFASGYAI